MANEEDWTRIRFADLHASGQFLKGSISKRNNWKSCSEVRITNLPFLWEIVHLLSLFALQSVVAPPLCHIGGDQKMLLAFTCKSRNHCRLGFFTNYNHFRVTQTGSGAGRGAVEHAFGHCLPPFAWGQTQPTLCHFIWVVTHTVFLRSTQLLPCSSWQ